jgi:hypothetical protein
MRASVAVVLSLLLAAACNKASPPPPPPPAPAKPPIRGAAGDADLRVMVSELASAKACQMLEGQFLALRAPDDPSLATGVLWIRDCKIKNADSKVTFEIAGSGWQWTRKIQHKAGGTFEINQYVRFGVAALVHGAFDIAYDTESHVVTLYFSPSATPQVSFTPESDVEVDPKGAWSSVLGALSSAISSSPDDIAQTQTQQQGTTSMEYQLAKGMAATVNLCTGLTRFVLGHPQKGQMAKPGVGQTTQVSVTMAPDGIFILGPQPAPKGVSFHLDATHGAVRASLVCADKAPIVARQFLAGKRAVVPALTATDVRGMGGSLAIKRVHCPVVAIVQPLDAQPATFTLRRPVEQSALASGGPLIRCGSKVADRNQ